MILYKDCNFLQFPCLLLLTRNLTFNQYCLFTWHYQEISFSLTDFSIRDGCIIPCVMNMGFSYQLRTPMLLYSEVPHGCIYRCYYHVKNCASLMPFSKEALGFTKNAISCHLLFYSLVSVSPIYSLLSQKECNSRY